MRHVAAIVQSTVILLLILVSSQVSWAQAELTDENRATAYADIDVKRLRENVLFKDINLNQLVDDRWLPVDFNSAVRVVLAGQCEDFDTLKNYDWNGDMPYSFYLHLTFDSPEWTAEFMQLDNLPKVEINGRTYHRPPDDANVSNCLIYVSETEFLFGTDDYVLHGSEQFLTEALQTQIDKLPENCVIRAGVDCSGGREFLSQLLDDENRWLIPNQLDMFLRPIPELDSLALSIDIENTNILKLIAVSPDEESAGDFHNSISQMLNMAKLSISMLATRLETDEQKATFKELTNRLKASREGTVTSLNVDQPDGFIDMASALTNELRMEAQRITKMNTFRQAVLAVHNFESAYQHMPFVPNEGSKWSEDLSWRARILPFMEYNSMWEQMDMTTGWDSETNKPMVDQMPEIYGDDGKTTRIAWIKSNVKGFGDITDGTSNTVMLLEYPDGIPWLEPKDLTSLEAIRLVKGLEDGEKLVAARYDGSVFMITNEFTPNQLRALFSPAGGEVMDFDQ